MSKNRFKTLYVLGRRVQQCPYNPHRWYARSETGTKIEVIHDLNRRLWDVRFLHCVTDFVAYRSRLELGASAKARTLREAERQVAQLLAGRGLEVEAP